MLVKMSSKHQITIPVNITDGLHLKKGDYLDIKRQGEKIVIIPKEVIVEDRYSPEDLLKLEEAIINNKLECDTFKSGDDLLNDLKKRAKK